MSDINTDNWPKIIASVKNPLGFMVLTSLIGLLIIIFTKSETVAFLVTVIMALQIIIVGLFAWFRPGHINEDKLEASELGKSIGIEIYTAFDGYLKDQDKLEAYGMLQDLCASRAEGLNTTSKELINALVDSVRRRSNLFDRAIPKGHLQTPENDKKDQTAY